MLSDGRMVDPIETLIQRLTDGPKKSITRLMFGSALPNELVSQRVFPVPIQLRTTWAFLFYRVVLWCYNHVSLFQSMWEKKKKRKEKKRKEKKKRKKKRKERKKERKRKKEKDNWTDKMHAENNISHDIFMHRLWLFQCMWKKEKLDRQKAWRIYTPWCLHVPAVGGGMMTPLGQNDRSLCNCHVVP